MNPDNIFKKFASLPKFRIQQIKKLIYQDFIDDWSLASTLPLNLRQNLAKIYPLLIDGKIFMSSDKQTLKALIKFSDGLAVETVLLKHKKRNTLCLSSQIGCALRCLFCATGKMGFKRNLTEGEIIDQVLFFSRLAKKSGESINNIVFMGMGEPFLNYDNVLKAIKIINDKDCFGLGARHISLSTAGISPGIEKLGKENIQINLAISLHAPTDQLRQQLMPSGCRFTISKILKAVDQYIKLTNRKVMFEYLMLSRVNDSDRHAMELAKIMKKSLYMVNLIPYNETGTFKPSSQERINQFKSILEKKGVNVTQRYSFGSDINAACGQLAGAA